jgi:ribosomal protein L11 methyltransferase
MPKMSFGTGHHQTTRLMCKKLFEIDLKNKHVLDMGCGTGILAILANLLGATSILGIDIDEWSVENSIENCKENNSSNIKIKKGNVKLLTKEKKFEIILANINKNILKSDMPKYSNTLATNGFLLLSGFFTTDVEELKQVATENNLKFISSNNENEWAMMLLQKN